MVENQCTSLCIPEVNTVFRAICINNPKRALTIFKTSSCGARVFGRLWIAIFGPGCWAQLRDLGFTGSTVQFRFQGLRVSGFEGLEFWLRIQDLCSAFWARATGRKLVLL